MRTEQKQESKILEFEASIGMDEKEFSVGVDQYKSFSEALDAVVKQFGGSDIPCHFQVEGDRYASWSFMISEEDLDSVIEKLEKLRGDFS